MSRKHFKIDLKDYSKGINGDMNKELLGGQAGVHVDALNMRSMSADGDDYAKKKIKGEESLYPNLNNRCSLEEPYAPLSATYECMATLEITEHIVEIWASTTPETFDPLIRVDGKIVLMSADFPVDVEHPLQYHKNENCVGGEIYITNNNTSPIILSLKDLMLNSAMTYDGVVGECTDKYFEGFILDEYTINVFSSVHKPKFIKQDTSIVGYDSVIGSGGLPIGSYSYSYRYSTALGDRSIFSPITELIPVTRNVSSQFTEHPYLRTYSGDPNLLSPTVYGNHIRLRIENFTGFEFIEVRRDSWYGGDAIGSPPVSEIIGSINILEGVSVLNILDKCDSTEVQEVLTLEESSDQLSSINSAKSIRYYNDKLWLFNVKYQSKDIDNQIDFVDDEDVIFPTIEKLGLLGHKHAYNSTYYKANMRGEIHGFGVILFDNAGNISYAKKITDADNFTFPNRRDLVSNLTKGTSYKGLVTAASTDIGTVDETHEVFDHTDAVEKTGGLQYNLLDAGGGDDTYYAVHPISQADTDGSGFEKPNVAVYETTTFASGDHVYTPEGFGLNYYSMGVSFKGINTSTLPNWVSGFSVVQTEPAGRVVAQGLGFYDLISSDGGLGGNSGKEVDSIVIYFPDLDEDTGINPSIVDELLDSSIASANYEIQLVSPLGFFTEVYSFLNSLFATPDSVKKGTDFVSYCRILYENGQINPTDSGGTVGNGGYVDFGTWRETSENDSLFGGVDGGNVALGITDISQITTESGTGKYFKITLDTSIYTEAYCNSAQDSEDPDVKKWHEPVYAVNLVKKNEAIADSITTQYKYTGDFTKIKSLIAIGTGGAISPVLVSERWEDCIQDIAGSVNNDYSTLEKFVTVKDVNTGTERLWLNVTSYTNGEIITVLTDIDNDGFYVATDTSGSYNVYGIYKHTETTDDICPIFTLVFADLGLGGTSTSYFPSNGSEIYVKYDNRVPVRVFGGDTYINESVWAIKDNVYDANGDPETGSDFRINVPFPYQGYELIADMRIIRDCTGIDKIQAEKSFSFDPDGASPARIRQFIAVWTAETRINLSFSFNDEVVKASVNQFFPLKNYIPRPYKWSTGDEDDAPTFISNNNLHSDYFDDYGYEWNLWTVGGFRFKPQTNIDYSKNQTTLLITSVPTVGFEEQTHFSTRIVWSLPRPINIQNTPTVRTFPSANLYDISDDTGEIKFAWSALSNDKGNNLYAITDNGVCLLLVDKRIIHEINANELATVGSDLGGILNQLWIDKNIGMQDETWRSWAEYSNMLFFCNKTSVYLFTDNQLTDLCQTGFREMFINRIAPYIESAYGSKLAGAFNLKNQEYILTFDKTNIDDETDGYDLIPQSIIFGLQQKMLQCRSSYVYDKYLQIDNKLYGMKDFVTYTLGVGNLLSGEEIEASVTGVSDAEIYFDKEFLRIRVNSNSKPEKIEFYDSYSQYLTGIPSSTVDAIAVPLSIKDYYGYECYVPRKTLTPFGRQQGRVLLFKIISTLDEDFLVSSTGIQYKQLK
jgi:hypothetical protein